MALTGDDAQVARDVHLFGVVDDPEPDAIEVRGLPELLGDAEVVETVPRLSAVDPHELVRVVAVPDAIGERHTEWSAPQQVGDEGHLFAVPSVEEGAAALENLLLDDRLVRAGKESVLGDAVRPDDSKQVGPASRCRGRCG